MRDYISLGPVPAYEECAGVGSAGYHERARAECSRYKQQLLRQFGEPPEGGRFGIKTFPHDFGSYHEVVIYYDDDYPDSLKFAIDVENNLPGEWDNNPITVNPHTGEVSINEYANTI